MPYETYLGDGLYVELEGDQVRLKAERDGMIHWVALEPEVLNTFIAWLQHVVPDFMARR